MSDPTIRLRPFREADLDLLTRFATDPAVSEPFEWFGFKGPEAFLRRWEEDGFLDQDPRYLTVVLQTDDAGIGWVMWRHRVLGIQAGVWEIGILLLPEHLAKASAPSHSDYSSIICCGGEFGSCHHAHSGLLQRDLAPD